jgi:hypothetical protein
MHITMIKTLDDTPRVAEGPLETNYLTPKMFKAYVKIM